MGTNKSILHKTRQYVEQKLRGESSGHDWWHVVRVVQNAQIITAKEGGDALIIELAALLHDMADWKFHSGDTTQALKVLAQFLEKQGADTATISQVIYIIEHISYKGGTNKHKMRSLEGKIVQDADRLDALGAVGIARTFAFGGALGREIYDPTVLPQTYVSFKDFQNKMEQNHTINHFYEKLLLIKDKMNTKTARQIATKRHKFMEDYLTQFYAEWQGKK